MHDALFRVEVETEISHHLVIQSRYGLSQFVEHFGQLRIRFVGLAQQRVANGVDSAEAVCEVEYFIERV